MKIAIISDVHNNLVNLKKVLDYCTKEVIETIVCCGDLASLETLDFLNDHFEGEILYTFGNMDNDQLKDYELADKYKKTRLFKDFGETDIENMKIAFVHYPDRAEQLCRTERYDFVFYGHSHKPWEQVINNCRMLNPGNVAGEIYPPTFAVWETENNIFDLIHIHHIQ
jgi:uncharacterized protein